MIMVRYLPLNFSLPTWGRYARCVSFNNSHNVFTAAACASGQTPVTSRWLFTDSADCGELVGQITNFYDTALRTECQIWLNLHEMPEKIELSKVAECYRLSNGTTKYRMAICCDGKSHIFFDQNYVMSQVI